MPFHYIMIIVVCPTKSVLGSPNTFRRPGKRSGGSRGRTESVGCRSEELGSTWRWTSGPCPSHSCPFHQCSILILSKNRLRCWWYKRLCKKSMRCPFSRQETFVQNVFHPFHPCPLQTFTSFPKTFDVWIKIKHTCPLIFSSHIYVKLNWRLIGSFCRRALDWGRRSQVWTAPQWKPGRIS